MEADANLRLHGIYIYPVKSCRGISLTQAEVQPQGLRHDREWMIVDSSGRFVSQREKPQLARVLVGFDGPLLSLSVLGHGSVKVPLQPQGGAMVNVTCWRDTIAAQDCGAQATEWLTDFLEMKARLVRFPSQAVRLCNPQWAGNSGASTRFADGYPFLVLGRASVADLRARLGLTELQFLADRFRANFLIDGLPAYEEDHIERLAIGDIELALVKPCARCSVPDVDQLTGQTLGKPVLDTLNTYRFNTSVQGAVLGVNAILTQPGVGRVELRSPLMARYRFPEQ